MFNLANSITNQFLLTMKLHQSLNIIGKEEMHFQKGVTNYFENLDKYTSQLHRPNT